MTLLPQELYDLIFLDLDFSTLENCRKIQSKFVKSSTQYSNFNDTIKGNNLKALKWLKETGYKYDWYTYFIAIENENPEIIRWLQDQGCSKIFRITGGIGISNILFCAAINT